GSSATVAKRILQSIEETDVTIVGVHNLSFYPSGGDHGLDAQQIDLLRKLGKAPNVLIVLMGNAYLLKNVCDARGMIVAYEDDSITQSAVAKVLLRQSAARGKLPVTPCPDMLVQPEEPVAVAEELAGSTSA